MQTVDVQHHRNDCQVGTTQERQRKFGIPFDLEIVWFRDPTFDISL